MLKIGPAENSPQERRVEAKWTEEQFPKNLWLCRIQFQRRLVKPVASAPGGVDCAFRVFPARPAGGTAVVLVAVP